MALKKDTTQFLESLKIRNSRYTDPFQPINLYNSLLQLSSGIYTEEERFIYELLQNADDAAKNSKLRVRIDIAKQHFIFSHDGEPFNEVDVESICSIGDGGKSNDENKTGYKGIGFKSVFSHSSSVAIKTGDYFFKFCEEDWKDYWQEDWVNKAEWKKDRIEKGKKPEVKMPWQIIPVPIESNGFGVTLSGLDIFNVSTILFEVKSGKMSQRVLELLKEPQILLFLRSKEIVLEVFETEKLALSINKKVAKNSIQLFCNNLLQSEWMVTSKNIAIPHEVIEEISKDDKTPPKLKGAKVCEISFAIQKEKSKLVSTDEALIYTYLPTSVSCGLPFVVNSNFITDSGRQQLQKESKWNLWIFNQMAYSYFEWIAELAMSGQLDKSFLSIIPDKLYFSELGSEFNKGYDKSLNEIAFLSNKNGKLLKVNQAVYDKSDLSKILSPKLITDYLNHKYSASYTPDSILPELHHSKKLKNLGVRIFGLDELDDFFSSDIFQSNHSLAENFELIRFLFNYVDSIKSSEEKFEWEEKLKSTPFIFDEKEVLRTPGEIYFPSVQQIVDFQEELHFVNKTILDSIESDVLIKEWLIKLGITEPTDINFINRNIINNKEFVTEKNAIQVGRYLFRAYKKNILDSKNFYFLRNVRFLTKNGTLNNAVNLFLSDFYNPEIKLESVCENDFYISEKYVTSSDEKTEWKAFLLKCSVNQSISLKEIRTSIREGIVTPKYFEEVTADAKKQAVALNNWPQYVGLYNTVSFNMITFTELAANYNFSKVFWKQVLVSIPLDEIKYHASVHWGMYGSTWKVENYFYWALKNLIIFPTKKGICLTVNETIVNDPEFSKIAGNYLPIFDCDESVPEEWLKILPFQMSLKLSDYLTVLSSIAGDPENLKDNKERIILIYKKLSENFLSQSNEIKAWAEENKLLSINDEFKKPTELKFINHPGFVADDLIYTDENITEGIVKLFELFGVTVIHEFKPEFIHPESNPGLKIRLQEILPYVLLIAEKRNNCNYSDSYTSLSDKIDQYDFVSAEDIILSYESNDEMVRGNSVRSYLTEGVLYYKGRWNNQMTLYSLISDISRFLEIKNLDDELRVLLLSDINDIQAFLSEALGIDITMAITRTEFSKSVEKVNSYTNDEDDIDDLEGYHDYSDERSRINISNLTKIQIFEKLKEKGFIVSDNIDINYTIVTGIKNPNGKPVKLVVKGGRKGKIYFNPGEWLALTETDSQLFVVTRGNIVRNVKINDLEAYNEIFLMRFNTRAFAVDTNLKAFAQFFRYLPYTHFIFNTPESTNDFMEEFGLNERNRSASDLSADDKELLY